MAHQQQAYQKQDEEMSEILTMVTNFLHKKMSPLSYQNFLLHENMILLSNVNILPMTRFMRVWEDSGLSHDQT